METIFLSQHRRALFQRLSNLEVSMAKMKADMIETAKLQTNSLQDSLDHSREQTDLITNFEIQERYIYERREILIALERIKKGSFGECDDCGDVIPTKRLLLQTSASLCVGCQQRKEAYVGLAAVSLQKINLTSPLTLFSFSEEVA
jgi:DnaK suppressor protein